MRVFIDKRVLEAVTGQGRRPKVERELVVMSLDARGWID